MSQFDGQVAVITGGANGIGRATADLFLEMGATVMAFDREAVPTKPNQESILVDLADLQSLEKAVQSTKEKFGKIDILINVAGISHLNMLLDLDRDLYLQTLDVNLHAPVFLMKFIGDLMVKQNYGRIVNITSIHGKQSEPASTAYDVSKGGLEAATRTAAIELAEFGILVNALAPGFVSTRMSITDGEDEMESDWFKEVYLRNKRLPILRGAQPIEIAHAIAWLASPFNTYLTGQTITVDGGMSARF